MASIGECIRTAHLAETVWVALHVGEVRHGRHAEVLLLIKTVGAPEGAVHFGARRFQLLGQLHRPRLGDISDCRRLHDTAQHTTQGLGLRAQVWMAPNGAEGYGSQYMTRFH